LGTPIFGNSKYLERRPYAPGVHGPKSRRKLTDYAVGLAEKQKLRYFYGLQERQFRNVYQKALRMRGVTGEKMLQLLESRLDNLIYQSGFAQTRSAARQMVGHGHIRVNGRKVSVPSFTVKVNDVLEVRDHNVSKQLATKNMESSTSRPIPDWVAVDREHLKAKLLRIPTRDEIQPIGNEQAVVEFYSR
jgi:small subunit ribosomal protein S4